MADPRRTIPQPTPVDPMSPSEIPPEFQPLPPGPLRVTEVMASGDPELAVIYKRTYTFEHAHLSQLADEQIPLDEEGALHDEITPGIPPSFRSLPEAIGFKTGTDVVIQASACPSYPTRMLTVGVQIGRYNHTAEVMGPRFCDYVRGKLVFTPPELFEEMPLRYENAYGGCDEKAKVSLMEEVRRITPPETLRRASPVGGAMLSENHPFMYPRNRFGKGYILEDRREFIEGRELPNIERPDDLLTPRRIIAGNPMNWNWQPLPAGFDYLDPYSFPRSSMLGFPPVGAQPPENVPEVTQNLIPSDFCRGSFFMASPADLPNIVHPDGSRCAPPDLWLPFLRGDEEVILKGMDAAHPEFLVRLPQERPEFTVPGLNPTPVKIRADLYLLLIDMEKRRLNMVWTGRTKLTKALMPAKLLEILSTIKIQIIRI